MMIKLITLITLLAVPFQSCTTGRSMSDNQKEKGHFRLYTYPTKLKTDTKDLKTFKKIVFISSNNFAGEIEPKSFFIPNKFQEERVLNIGGLAALKAYVDIFKKKYKESAIYIDAGSFMAKTKEHNRVLFLFNYLQPDIAALGSNELQLNSSFKTYQSYLERLTTKIKFPLVASNLFDLTKAKGLEIANVKPFYLKQVDGLTVGVMNILNPETASKDLTNNLNGIYIQPMAKNIITKAREMRSQGAQIIVMLTNTSIDCNSQIAEREKISINKVNFDPRRSSHCMTYKNKLIQVLKKIPPSTLDLIITSDGKNKLANFIQGIPVMQNAGGGEYLSWAELYYDEKLKRVVSEKAKLQQPIQLCHQFLKDNEDCYYDEDISEQELVPASLFGEKIQIRPLPTN